MKDRSPSSYGAVYIPPHHRLRSEIAKTATATTASAFPPRAINSKPALTNNNNQSSFVNSRNNNIYLPPQHFQQVKKKSLADDVSSEGSDRDIELSVHPVRLEFT